MAKDYYGMLGVPRNASEKAIKQAYRRLARRSHPDVNPGDKAAEARFKEINEAYQVLSDPERRRRYDRYAQRYGDHWEQAEEFEQAARQRGAGAHGFDPADLFRGRGQARAGEEPFVYRSDAGESFDADDLFGDRGPFGDLFGGLFRGAGRQARSGGARASRDLTHEVEVTLEEAFQGTTRVLQLETEQVCSDCRGAGKVAGVPCAACRGSGRLGQPRRLEVKIPPGVATGSRVRVALGAGPANGSGSLYLDVKVRPHDRFERRGDDLYAEVPVPLYDALLGGEVAVATLRGTVALRIPPQTQNGRQFRLAGRGMPHLKGNGAGDLYVRASVMLPEKLTVGEQDLFAELRRMRDGEGAGTAES